MNLKTALPHTQVTDRWRLILPDNRAIASKMDISSVLLLGTENAVALPVVRSLGSLMPDLRIHALSRDDGHYQIARYSKYVHSHQFIRSDTEEELLKELKDKVKETHATILLPVDEYFVRVLSSIKDELGKAVCLPPLPGPDLFDSLVYKNRLSEVLVQSGLPSAVTYPLHQVDPSQTSNEFFPCLLKPVFGASGREIVKITDRDMLRRYMKRLDTEKFIIQEYIPGMDIGCSMLAVNGEIKALTTQKSLAKKGFSFSTAIRFKYYPEVADLVRQLIRHTGYSGLADLDFRLDERDGQPKLTDFNARFWRSLLGSKAAGIDFTLLNCFAAMGIPFDMPEFTESTYLMGKSTIAHYQSKFNFSSGSAIPVTTDLWSRITDPFPEIIRFL
ncbi:MAG: ATP-grasp domain-containing protein [Balneolaceae bacterium]